MKKNAWLIVASFVATVCSLSAQTTLPASFKEIQMDLPKGAKIIDVGANAAIKTLEDALAHVAEIRKTDVKTPLALRVASGDYTPAGGTLDITKAHAATNFAPLVIYASDFSKRPHIHGGVPFKNWTKTKMNGKDNVWVADASALGSRSPMTILFNGTKMLVARWPNIAFNANPYKGDFLFVGAKDVPAGKQAKDVKTYSDELWIRPEQKRNWAHPEDGAVLIFPKHYYSVSSARISNVVNRVINLKTKRMELYGLHRYDMWAVVNIAEELDIPGEWYFNPREKKIYFITPDGSDPNRGVITATQHAQPVVRLSEIGNCTLAGLELSGGGDGLFFKGASHHVDVLGCSVHDIGGSNHRGGGTGVNMTGTYLRVMDCDIYNIGNNGIWHSSWTPATVKGRQHNVIENNYIHHCGVVATWNFGQGLTYKNNLIHDIDGSAFSGYGRFLDICYNRMRHICISAQDTGALYDSGWGNGTGTKIRYNHITDVIGKKGNEYYNGACGIYFDECTGGADVYGNHIERAHWAAMHLHCGRWINISNNVFVCNAQWAGSIYSWQMSISDWGPYQRGFGNRNLHVGEYNLMVKNDPEWKKFPAFSQDANTDAVYANDGWMMMGNRFERNIVYYPGQAGSGQLLNASHLNVTTNFFNHNVYWADGREIAMNTHHPSGMSFAAWRARGADRDTLVADPLFLNPKKGDYRLRPESPAFEVGFVELPYEKMGLQKTKFRPELPVEAEGLREHPEWLRK